MGIKINKCSFETPEHTLVGAGDVSLLFVEVAATLFGVSDLLEEDLSLVLREIDEMEGLFSESLFDLRGVSLDLRLGISSSLERIREFHHEK